MEPLPEYLLLLNDINLGMMLLASFVCAVLRSEFRGTAIFMLVFALFFLFIDPILSMRSDDNPWMVALADFLGFSLVLVWGSKSTKDMHFLTAMISILFLVAMVVEIQLIRDVNNDTVIVYHAYELMTFILSLGQAAILFVGVHYGPVRSKDTDTDRAPDSGAVEVG